MVMSIPNAETPAITSTKEIGITRFNSSWNFLKLLTVQTLVSGLKNNVEADSRPQAAFSMKICKKKFRLSSSLRGDR
jgi:hypothetical protein